MTPASDALASHGLVDLAEAVAEAHHVASVFDSQEAAEELILWLVEWGWSRRNAERAVGVDPPPPVVVASPTRRPLPAPLPPAEPVHLVVVSIEAIASARDIFHCPPYAARLSAGSCVARQTSEHEPKRVRWQHSGGARQRFMACLDCAVGRRVAEKLAQP